MKIIVTGGSGFIGSHLIERLARCDYQVINLDIKRPAGSTVPAIWVECSVLNSAALVTVFKEHRPRYVIHLAAHASMEARSLDEFRANTEGTVNLLAAIKAVSSVERVIITSTQHVRKPGSGPPVGDTDFAPYMYYGQSKVITECRTREAELPCAWTIVRPTAVWGPGNLLLAGGLWRLIERGHYFHPNGDPVIRSYGYVKNVAWQYERLLNAPRDKIDRKVFYLADGNMLQVDWVNSVALQLTGHEVRTLPLWIIKALARVGDGVRAVGLSFPIYDSRLHNLITHNPVPVEPTLELLGIPPYSLQDGARETAEWLKAYYRRTPR